MNRAATETHSRKAAIRPGAGSWTALAEAFRFGAAALSPTAAKLAARNIRRNSKPQVPDSPNPRGFGVPDLVYLPRQALEEAYRLLYDEAAIPSPDRPLMN